MNEIYPQASTLCNEQVLYSIENNVLLLPTLIISYFIKCAIHGYLLGENDIYTCCSITEFIATLMQNIFTVVL